MPRIFFICDSCGEETDDLLPFNVPRVGAKCSCGSKKRPRQDFTPRGKIVTGDKQRVSTALGVHVSQIASGEAEKIHPGATYDRDGNMLIKNYAEKKQRLRERNWVDRDEGKGWY